MLYHVFQMGAFSVNRFDFNVKVSVLMHCATYHREFIIAEQLAALI